MLKKLILILASLLVLANFANCKKEKASEKMIDANGGVKYAKFKAAVDKKENLTEWLATLEKAEKVTVLEETKTKDSKGKDVTVSKVRLSDDNEGYIQSDYLGNEPLVFTKNAKAYIRPSPLVAVYAEIPEGTIGFIIETKDGWTQVYVGKVNGKYVTSQWVEDASYSKDRDLLIDAKKYEAAMDLKSQNKNDDFKKAIKDLSEEAKTDFFRNLAASALSPDEAPAPSEENKDQTTQP